MIKTISFVILFLLLAGSLLAQTSENAYYAPYNFPNKYESDKLNKNFSLTFAFPVGGDYYSMLLYGDVARIRITEFMNINFGIGATGGYSSHKTDIYSINDEKAYNQKIAYFAKAIAGGGITFRLANPLNLSVRSGIQYGYEYYRTAEVRPILVGSEWEKIKYNQNTDYFRPGFFYNVTLFYKLKKIAIGLSHGSYYLATGPEMMNSIGFVFPLGN